MKMKVRIESGEILVNAEYNSAFVKKARQLQGKWKSPNWVFPEDNREEIKALLIDTYGCADILEGENEQKVTLVSDIDINVLTEEKERLLVRIAEIDAILAKNDNFTEGK